MFVETIVFPQAREYTKRTAIITFYMEENTMDKFIPIDKQSKKKQKEFYAKQRNLGYIQSGDQNCSKRESLQP